MTNPELLKLAFDQGWNAFWNAEEMDKNPHTNEDLRDEWSNGWISAKNAEEYNL